MQWEKFRYITDIEKTFSDTAQYFNSRHQTELQTRNQVTMVGQSSHQARDQTMEKSEHQDFNDAVEDVLAADMEVSMTAVENFDFGDDTNDNKLDLTNTLVKR